MIRTHNVMIRHETLLGKCVIIRVGSWRTSHGTVALTYVSSLSLRFWRRLDAVRGRYYYTMYCLDLPVYSTACCMTSPLTITYYYIWAAPYIS